MTEALAASTAEIRTDAGRGLAVFFALVVVLSGTVEAIWILNPEMSILVIPLMWSPAVASVITRLIFKEGFSDVSFRFGAPHLAVVRAWPGRADRRRAPRLWHRLAYGTGRTALFFGATSQVLCEETFGGGVEFQAVFGTGEAVAFVLEEQVLVVDAFLLHGGDELL
jgi:hypothetical protein